MKLLMALSLLMAGCSTRLPESREISPVKADASMAEKEGAIEGYYRVPNVSPVLMTELRLRDVKANKIFLIFPNSNAKWTYHLPEGEYEIWSINNAYVVTFPEPVNSGYKFTVKEGEKTSLGILINGCHLGWGTTHNFKGTWEVPYDKELKTYTDDKSNTAFVGKYSGVRDYENMDIEKPHFSNRHCTFFVFKEKKPILGL